MTFNKVWFIIFLLISFISMGSNLVLGLLSFLTALAWMFFTERYGRVLLVVWAFFTFFAFLL